MPGAPNRPPEVAAPAASPPTADPPEVKVLRRLVPSHVALLQETWKGTVPAEILAPFERAEAAFRGADFPAATSALDQLSIRFAEPRWPTLREPFRRLRVPIPAPVPPHWDPDHGLAPAEKEARRTRRTAEDQLALAEASVAWATTHGIQSDDLAGWLASAKEALAAPGVPSGFYAAVDQVWRGLHVRLPPPGRSARPAAPPVSDGG